MKHLSQTRDGNCGQTCIAMISRTEIEEVEKIMRSRGMTSTKQIRDALSHLGFSLESTTRAGRGDQAMDWSHTRVTTLLFVRYAPVDVIDESHHWALWDPVLRRVLDPGLDEPVSAASYVMLLDHHGGRVTSFAIVGRRS